MHRHFEFVGGNSAKFWEVEVTGTKVGVRFGRLGTAGQCQTKEFADASAASEYAEKLIGEKVRKGYRESAAAKPVASVV